MKSPTWEDGIARIDALVFPRRIGLQSPVEVGGACKIAVKYDGFYFVASPLPGDLDGSLLLWAVPSLKCLPPLCKVSVL